MGLEGIVDLSDEVIEYIIEEYTCEPGVRKLKEILFEIVGEINLSILKDNGEHDLPIAISVDDIKYKYLEDRHEMRKKKIHTTSAVGLISGLWANAMGQGGVLPIEAKFYPCATFLDLKLTGMQGDVMKESMIVWKKFKRVFTRPNVREFISTFLRVLLQRTDLLLERLSQLLCIVYSANVKLNRILPLLERCVFRVMLQLSEDLTSRF